MDTPGMVSTSELKQYKLATSFQKDAKDSLQTADIIGVMQDSHNLFTRDKINSNVLELLKEKENKIPLILILNKVDKLKKKSILLHLVTVLTKAKNSLKFTDIFMISALNGDGINDLRVSFCKMFSRCYTHIHIYIYK